jgi:hypothetical protein
LLSEKYSFLKENDPWVSHRKFQVILSLTVRIGVKE